MDSSKPCFNCPQEVVATQCCSKCKYALYCSPLCQKEHWYKVHKKQCKTLAGEVDVPVSTHLPESCLGCREENVLRTDLNSPDCPEWGCLIGPDPDESTLLFPKNKLKDKFPSAVESGEMTRRFPCRAEQTVFIMQHILSKLTRTKSRLAIKCKTEMTRLSDFLDFMRTMYMEKYHEISFKHVDRLDSFDTHVAAMKRTTDLVEDSMYPICKVSMELGSRSGDPFLAWETFTLLWSFAQYNSREIRYMKNYENLTGMRENQSRKDQMLTDELGPSTWFDEMWDSMLAALEAGLVHHSSLLDILCEGRRDQVCDECGRSITIERFFCIVMDVKPEIVFKKPFVTFRRRIFSCEAIDCQERNKYKEVDFLCKINDMVVPKILAISVFCDYCDMVGSNMHRCGECKTKLYCSEECKQLDWKEVHSKICNEGKVAGKKKEGKKKRQKAGKREMEKLEDFLATIQVESSEVD